MSTDNWVEKEVVALKNFEQRFGRTTDMAGNIWRTVMDGNAHETYKALQAERLRRFEQANVLIKSALEIMKGCP